MRMENTPTIETERLILRKFTPNDVDAFFQLMRDEEVNRFLPWFPLQTLAEADAFLAQTYLKAYSRPSGYRYAICLREENLPIGYVAISDGESHDLGYALRKEFWNRGIVTEAARAVVERVKSAGYGYLTATHDVNNPQSGKVMKKLGMIYQYSYVEQWQPKNFPVTFRLYQLNFDPSSARPFLQYWNQRERHFIERL